jgi:hypothetical protein
MKRIALKLVALFEIIYGIFGLVLVVGGMIGRLPYGVVPLLWYGVFPLVSLIAGVFLWLRWKYAFVLSVLVLVLQVPFIFTGGLLLNLGAPMNLTFSGTWLSRDGLGATMLGINFLALGVLFVLLWCRSALRNVSADAASNNGMHPTAS